MAAYIVATVRITDAARFAEYARGIAGLSERFGGEALVRGAVTEVLEGDGVVGERVIVSRYPDRAAVCAYLESADYVAAARHRTGAAEIEMRLIDDAA